MSHKVLVLSIVVVGFLALSPWASAEIVQIHPGSGSTAANALRQLETQGRVLHRNPHDGSVLLEVPDGALLDVAAVGGRVFRDVGGFPVSIPGSVRLLAEVALPSQGGLDDRDVAADVAKAVGGGEVWRSRFTGSMQFDVPVDRVGDFVAAAPLEKYWFNYHGQASLEQSVPKIGVTSALPYYWPSGWGTQYIAVLDTGVVSGGALAGRVDHTLGACFSANRPNLVSSWHSTCPNEAHEYYGTTAALPCSAPLCMHGSHVAAVAVSDVAPNLGVIASPKVKILPIQVFTQNDKGTPNAPSDDLIYPFVDDVQRALDFVIQAGLVGQPVAAVNMSFNLSIAFPEGLCDGPLDDLLRSLDWFGVAVIAAAGNVGSDGTYDALDEPACYETVISVGATTDWTDFVAVNIQSPAGPYSTQSHALMDFWAPGTHITTPVEAVQLFGSSFSAPHVAAVWTRLRGRYPSASNAWIKSQLENNCPKKLDGRNSVYKPRICWLAQWQ